MENGNTNWYQSVTGVVIRDNKVLVARHTYGSGKGLYIIPGGYVELNETPQEALKREFLEEVSIVIEPKQIIGIRFNMHDWYIAFYAEYISGEAKSDGNENDEVVWMDIDEALSRNDVPDLTKKLVRCALKKDAGFNSLEYSGSNPPNSLYGTGV